jgi:hypothetical protein
VTSYTARVVEDDEGPILIFPEELSRELDWPVGTEVRIEGDQNCFTIELVKKSIGDSQINSR